MKSIASCKLFFNNFNIILRRKVFLMKRKNMKLIKISYSHCVLRYDAVCQGSLYIKYKHRFQY